jgi:hypothetical protein
MPDVASSWAGSAEEQEPRLLTFLAPAEQLPMQIRPAVAITDDRLFELCRANRDLRIERTADGELVIMAPTGGETGRRTFELTVLFGQWAREDGSGVGFDSSTGFLLPNGAERSPDLAWIRRARWEALSEDDRERFVPVCGMRCDHRDLMVDSLSCGWIDPTASPVARRWKLVRPRARRPHPRPR